MPCEWPSSDIDGRASGALVAEQPPCYGRWRVARDAYRSPSRMDWQPGEVLRSGLFTDRSSRSLPASEYWAREAASAAPSTPATLVYEFTGCTGSRTGTFTAVKQPSGAAGLQPTDGSATFVFMESIDVQSGVVEFTTPGFKHNGLPTVTCDLIHPTTQQELLVTGLLAPVKK